MEWTTQNWLRWGWWALLIAQLALLAYVIPRASAQYPFAFAMSVAPIYSVVTFLTLSLLARHKRRPIPNRDVVRIGAWTLFAFALGVKCAPYFEVFAARHWYAKEVASICAMIFSLLAILYATFRMSLNRQSPEQLQCCSCGYNLTGNTSGRCPECGDPR